MARSTSSSRKAPSSSPGLFRRFVTGPTLASTLLASQRYGAWQRLRGQIPVAHLRNTWIYDGRVTVVGRLTWAYEVTANRWSTPARECADLGLDSVPLEVLLLDREGTPAASPLCLESNGRGFFSYAGPVKLLNVVSDRDVLNLRVRLPHGIVNGSAQCAVLPSRSHGSTVCVSDLDRTYLEADFDSLIDVLGLLFRTAHGRTSVPGMREVLLALQRRSNPQPVVFLTGSPFFFQRTTESRLEADGFEHPVLITHPFPPQGAGPLSTTEVKSLLLELTRQFGHKARELLELANRLPDHTGIILLGDDAEVDRDVYEAVAGVLDQSLKPDRLLTMARQRKATSWELRAMEENLALLQKRKAPPRVRFIGIRCVGDETHCPPWTFPSCPGVNFRSSTLLSQALKENDLL